MRWLGFWISPLPLLFLLACAGAVRARRAPAGRWLAALALGMWLCSTEVVLRPAVERLETRHPRGEPVSADAIVVLGGYSDPSLWPGTPPEFHAGVDRVIEGRHLLARGVAPRLVLSGAASSTVGPEDAEATRVGRWLVDLGVPEERLVLETRSRNTAENARETARIARELGIRRVVLVTSALHMPRAVACFEKAGLEVLPHPVDHLVRGTPLGPAAWIPSERWLFNAKVLWHEVAGTLYYRIRGHI